MSGGLNLERVETGQIFEGLLAYVTSRLAQLPSIVGGPAG